MKVVLREKLIAPSGYIKNLEKSHTSDLTTQLKEQNKRKQTHSGGVDGRK